MNVSKKTISAEIAKLNLSLNARRSTDELKLLTDIWFVDCQHMLENRFVEAIAVCRKTSKWFPTVSEINQHYDQIVRNIPEKPMIEGPRLSAKEEAKHIEKLKAMMEPEKEPTMYINAKYKPDRPMSKNVVYVSEPFEENKRMIKHGKFRSI